jgi:fumarate reductase subunit C
MSAPPAYWRPVPGLWWTKKRSYFVFVMRELSCIFVGWFAVYLMMLLYAIGRGEPAYEEFLAWAASPVVVVVNVVALAFLLLHTVTWFALTPQATVVRLRGRRVPSAMIIASQYVGLAVVSAFIAWLVLR